jgi:signal transduction histidine kinase/CheY-like chemotaxis protein/ligand-binding sensor domain-containing protein/HPt (histidine-containing phosphotransfer) domain-containing protein
MVLWLAASEAWAQQGRPILTFFGPQDTGSGDIYWTTAQDARGVLYFGSDVVASFDGERWRRYSVPGSYAVRALAVSPSGRLWVGAMNEIGYFDPAGTGQLSAYHSLVPKLPPETPPLGDVWHAFAWQDGAVFVTRESVLVWDGRTFTQHRLEGARRIAAIESRGEIFLSHVPSGLWKITNRNLQPVLTARQLEGSGVGWIEAEGAGWLMVTTDGLARFSRGELTRFAPEASEFIRKNVLTAACRLPTGDLCIGTLGGMLIVNPSGSIERILTQDNGLRSRSVYSLFRAEDGAIWVGSGVGLMRIVLDKSVSLFDPLTGLKGKGVRGIAEAEGRIFAATDEAVFQVAQHQTGSAEFSALPELTTPSFDLLGEGDSLFIAGYKGVERWRDGQRSKIFSSQNDTFVLARAADDASAILLVSDLNVVRLHPNERPVRWETIGRLSDMPLSLVQDSAGYIWASTVAKGIFRMAPAPDTTSSQVAELVIPTPGLVTQIGNKVAILSSRGLELAAGKTIGSGAGSDTPALPALAVSNPDAERRAWVAYASPFSDGPRTPLVGRVSLDARGEVRWEPFAVPGLNEIGGVTKLFVDSQGAVWVGGSVGLLRLNPARLHPIAPPRAPLLEGSMPVGSRMPSDQNSATFRFAALEYGRREAVRYQTRLSGMSAGWSAPSNDSSITLAGLSDGDYEFSVRVVNDAGLSSPAATWRFTVLPPWYRTKTALTAWGLLAAAGFFGLTQWRSAYLRRRNERLEQLVKKKTEQLEKANAAKSEFLANMSHEIRNPISGIVGLSLAMEETALDERQRQLADSIRSCASLLATLVDDVLDFSKIEAGKIDLRPAAFDVRAIIEQCIAMVAEEARKTGSRITTEFALHLPDRLIGDSARVQQIVLNYLTNAVKFGAGKPIAVGAKPVAETGRVQLFVRDEGPGMTEAEAASLFTKFTRLQQAHVKNIRGSGLGLAVCRLLATKMGGSVGVDSQPGKGSRFWVELPLAPAGLHPSAAPDTPRAPSAPLSALIVEDIDYNATAMQAVLRKLGIVSEVASDGPTALAKLQSTTYDVAFMDWNLPGMIGTEVVSRYRAVEPPNHRTIIIATTAYSGDFNREACLRAGMDAFISKPFTPEKISAAINDLRASLRAAASVEIGPRIDSPPPPQGIDLQMLRFLADESADGLGGQIDRYLASFEADYRSAREIIANGDGKEIHRIAHRLVSHASMVKAEPLTSIARELQANSGAADADKIWRLYDEFEREFAALRGKLDLARNGKSPA